VLVDLRGKDMTGAAAQDLLEDVGIICNKNRIPFDPLGAEKTSGIRLGTSAATSRGFREPEMTLLVEMIDRALSGSVAERGKVKQDVKRLCTRFPLLSDPFGMEAACMDQ
jgi:glycine hydroxymethyltransferase